MDLSKTGVDISQKDALSLTVDDLKGVKALITDPPYGISLNSHCKRGVKDRKSTYKIEGDEDQSAGNHVLEIAREAGVETIVMFASPQKPWPGKFRNWVVWDKGGGVGFGGDTKTCFRRTWELIQIENKREISGRPESVWRVTMNNAIFKMHPCAKPVELMKKILLSLNVTGLVLDPFMGSGSTGVACANLGIPFRGFEIDPMHFATAQDRINSECLEQSQQGRLF